jgi:hypothetical protein
VSVADWSYRYEERERLGFSEKTLGSAQLEGMIDFETWQSWPAKLQLIFMGGTKVPDEVRIRRNRLYVLGSGPTCTKSECLIKGADYDPHGNQQLTDTPLTVEGDLRAFATGEQIMEQPVRLSALTTALFYYAENFVSDKFIINELNAIAPKLVTDINKDGAVDYADILEWSRQRNEKQYLGDISDLDEFAGKIRDNDDYYFRLSWIDIVGSEGARRILGQEYVGSIDGFDGYQLADADVFGTDGVPNPQTLQKALWLGERSTDQKIYSIEWWGYYKLEDLPSDSESVFFWLDLYTGHDSGVPDSRILRKKVKADVAPNPSYPYQELRVTSEYEEYNGRLVYRYNAVLEEPLLIPREAKWFSIVQIDPVLNENNSNFVLLASTEGDSKVSFSTQYGWITPSYDRPRRSPLRVRHFIY